MQSIDLCVCMPVWERLCVSVVMCHVCLFYNAIYITDFRLPPHTFIVCALYIYIRLDLKLPCTVLYSDIVHCIYVVRTTY